MGNNNNTNHFDCFIQILLNKPSFYENESITGVVWISPKKTLVFSEIILKLTMMEKWEIKSFVHEDNICQYNFQILLENFLDVGIPQLTENKSLPAGDYRFPFILPIIGQMSPTFEYNNGTYIRYTIEFKVISSFIKHLSAATPVFIKRGPSILLSPLVYSSCTNVNSWGLFGQGSTVMKVSYPSNNYRMNDSVPLTININNTVGLKNVKQIKVNLKQIVTYKKVRNEGPYIFKVKVFEKLYDFTVRSKQSKEDIIVFPLFVPKKYIPYYHLDVKPKHIDGTNYSEYLPSVESFLISLVNDDNLERDSTDNQIGFNDQLKKASIKSEDYGDYAIIQNINNEHNNETQFPYNNKCN